jgi:hypothetical protein
MQLSNIDLYKLHKAITCLSLAPSKTFAPPTLPNTKAFKWLSIKSRVKGFLRVGIDVILDWF